MRDQKERNLEDKLIKKLRTKVKGSKELTLETCLEEVIEDIKTERAREDYDEYKELQASNY